MYEPDSDSIVVYANDSDPFILNCQKCNSSVILDNPNDIVYLYRLAQDAPLLYAELALKADGLQRYVDAMNEFNYSYLISLCLKLFFEFSFEFF